MHLPGASVVLLGMHPSPLIVLHSAKACRVPLGPQRVMAGILMQGKPPSPCRKTFTDFKWNLFIWAIGCFIVLNLSVVSKMLCDSALLNIMTSTQVNPM